MGYVTAQPLRRILLCPYCPRLAAAAVVGSGLIQLSMVKSSFACARVLFRTSRYVFNPIATQPIVVKKMKHPTENQYSFGWSQRVII